MDRLRAAHAVSAIMAEVTVAVANCDCAAVIAAGCIGLELGELFADQRGLGVAPAIGGRAIYRRRRVYRSDSRAVDQLQFGSGASSLCILGFPSGGIFRAQLGFPISR